MEYLERTVSDFFVDASRDRTVRVAKLRKALGGHPGFMVEALPLLFGQKRN